ncbi:MAG: class I SAM-dependent rRNA methyltransferase [Clostridia bacterium]|nr:MAG: class I SAM-dependent rRNA methyltransferase [Clostridia bacterium]
MTKHKSSRHTHRTTHIFISPKLKSQMRTGHPWIYRDAIERAPRDLPSGVWVRVQSANQQAIGLWDAEGPIAIRLFSAKNIPGAGWIKARVQEAWQRREPLRHPDHRTTAWRWIYGESDSIPGLVVDFYGDAESGKKWAVLKSYSPSLERIQKWVVDALKDITPLNGIINRSGANWKLLAGAPPADEIIIEENGTRFAVDILRGQKTGFFLDQRDNRQTVARWSSGKRVLNLFSYTGGFSVAAALAGASQVTSVDSAPVAITTAKRNFRINNLNPADHGFEIADAFEMLERYHGEGNHFDLIVVDPPSFARSKAQLTNALHAYRRLNALAMRCLGSNGILATSSCTSQVSPTAFNAMLAEAAADARRRFIIQHEAAQPLDHPVAAQFPEGRYLKFVLGEVAVLP